MDNQEWIGPEPQSGIFGSSSYLEVLVGEPKTLMLLIQDDHTLRPSTHLWEGVIKEEENIQRSKADHLT